MNGDLGLAVQRDPSATYVTRDAGYRLFLAAGSTDELMAASQMRVLSSFAEKCREVASVEINRALIVGEKGTRYSGTKTRMDAVSALQEKFNIPAEDAYKVVNAFGRNALEVMAESARFVLVGQNNPATYAPEKTEREQIAEALAEYELNGKPGEIKHFLQELRMSVSDFRNALEARKQAAAISGEYGVDMGVARCAYKRIADAFGKEKAADIILDTDISFIVMEAENSMAGMKVHSENGYHRLEEDDFSAEDDPESVEAIIENSDHKVGPEVLFADLHGRDVASVGEAVGLPYEEDSAADDVDHPDYLSTFEEFDAFSDRRLFRIDPTAEMPETTKPKTVIDGVEIPRLMIDEK